MGDGAKSVAGCWLGFEFEFAADGCSDWRLCHLNSLAVGLQPMVAVGG
jgi:hypothetical protein